MGELAGAAAGPGDNLENVLSAVLLCLCVQTRVMYPPPRGIFFRDGFSAFSALTLLLVNAAVFFFSTSDGRSSGGGR